MVRSSTKIRSTKGSTRHTFFLPGRGTIDKAIRLYLDQFDDFTTESRLCLLRLSSPEITISSVCWAKLRFPTSADRSLESRLQVSLIKDRSELFNPSSQRQKNTYSLFPLSSKSNASKGIENPFASTVINAIVATRLIAGCWKANFRPVLARLARNCQDDNNRTAPNIGLNTQPFVHLPNNPAPRSASVALLICSKAIPDRTAISKRSCRPSEKFSTQSIALSSTALSFIPPS
jgi:hypothetical protein